MSFPSILKKNEWENLMARFGTDRRETAPKNCPYEIEKARQELNALSAQQETLADLVKQAKEYFMLFEKQQPTPADELRLKMYKTVLECNNIQSRSDFEHLKSVVADTQKKSCTPQRKL